MDREGLDKPAFLFVLEQEVSIFEFVCFLFTKKQLKIMAFHDKIIFW